MPRALIAAPDLSFSRALLTSTSHLYLLTTYLLTYLLTSTPPSSSVLAIELELNAQAERDLSLPPGYTDRSATGLGALLRGACRFLWLLPTAEVHGAVRVELVKKLENAILRAEESEHGEEPGAPFTSLGRAVGAVGGAVGGAMQLLQGSASERQVMIDKPQLTELVGASTARSLLATYGADPPDESAGKDVAYGLWVQQLPRGVIERFGVVGDVMGAAGNVMVGVYDGTASVVSGVVGGVQKGGEAAASAVGVRNVYDATGNVMTGMATGVADGLDSAGKAVQRTLSFTPTRGSVEARGSHGGSRPAQRGYESLV